MLPFDMVLSRRHLVGRDSMFTIGEFSKLSGLTVKTLRFYHEQGLLIPKSIDEASGYRYYDESQLEAARVIRFLRELDFPLPEIADMLRQQEESNLLEVLQRHRSSIEQRIRTLRTVSQSLDRLIAEERRRQASAAEPPFEVEEKSLPPLLVAGIRQRGKYCDCGQSFGRLGRSFGRHVCGPCFLLHYDMEYQEDGADFEACLPVRQSKTVAGVSVRELEGGPCVSLLHRGPYDELGGSYAIALKHAKRRGYRVRMPTREIYLKGPGMLFRGNPQKYLTEIQLPIEV